MKRLICRKRSRKERIARIGLLLLLAAALLPCSVLLAVLVLFVVGVLFVKEWLDSRVPPIYY